MTLRLFVPRRCRRAGGWRRRGRERDRCSGRAAERHARDRAHRLARPLLAGADGRGRDAGGARRLRPGRCAGRRGLLDAIRADGAHTLRLGPTEDIPWLKRQTRLTFARCGIVDPLSLDDYRAHGGYRGSRNARCRSAPEAIVEEVTQSGLRGRGGAGFPTGIKWRTVAQTQAEQKYIVCNADEGDSGTFADRMIMEGDPFVLIEGMTIAGIAVGATQGLHLHAAPNIRTRLRPWKRAIDIARATAATWARSVAGQRQALRPRSARRRRRLCLRRRDLAARKPRRASAARSAPSRRCRRSRACSASRPSSTT